MKILSILLGVTILLGSTLSVSAQDDAWTCDNGEQDVLNAAQQAFDEGDLATAEELVVIAEKLCAAVPSRAIKATQLHSAINSAQRPTAIPIPAERTEAKAVADEASHLFFSEKDYANAALKYEEALLLYENLEADVIDATDQARALIFIHMQLGDCYRELEDYKQALEHLGTALLLSKSSEENLGTLEKDIEDRIVFTQTIMGMEIEWTCDGGLYDLARAGRFTYRFDEEEGHRMTEDALDLCWDNPVRISIIINILTIMDGNTLPTLREYEQGLTALAEGNYRPAAGYFKDTLEFYERAEFEFGQSAVMYSLGQTYLIQERYDEALPYFTDGLVLAEKLEDPILIAMHQEGLGDLYAAQGMTAEAAEAYQLALDQLKTIKRDSDRLDAMATQIEDKISALDK